MNIRLIGLGEVGHEVVSACQAYFRDRQIGALMESQRVVKLSTKGYADTLSGLRNLAEGLLRSPEAFRSLRKALAYLYFGGPDRELAQRWSELAPRSEGVALRPDVVSHHEFMTGLYARLEKRGQLAAFESQLRAGFEAHEAETLSQGQFLGSDWLITPDLPTVEADPKPRHAAIGRELMKGILKSKNNNLVRLTGNLGLVEAEVDVVAVAFSVGDSFGGSGADELARAIREILQELEHNRIVALLGLAVYESDIDVLDGRYVGDYLRVNRELNHFDGLIARRSSTGERSIATLAGKAQGAGELTKRARASDAYEGFAPILATIAMSSDPRVIQIDNPDANQLQRDFAKSLVSCGFAQANDATPEPGNTRVVASLYNQAKQNLVQQHSVTERFQMLKTLEEESRKLAGAQGEGQSKSNWKPSPWIEKLCDPTKEPGAIERMTARKVVAYVGYNETIQGDEIKALREAMARDFPRARTVIYKYHVGNVLMWANRPKEIGVETPTAAAPPTPQPVPQVQVQESSKTTQPAGGRSVFSRLLGGSAHASPPVGGLGFAAGVGTLTPPSGTNLAAQKPQPVSAQQETAEPTMDNPVKLQPHLAIFVVDSLETLAVERFWDFLLRSVTVREKSGGRALDRPTDFARAKVVKQRLLARALLSLPGIEDNWNPPYRDAERGILESAPRDTILGCVNNEFRRKLLEIVQSVVEGEKIRATHLRDEVQRFYETINTEQMPLTRKSWQGRLEATDIADILCGLNWLCNEELDKRKVCGSLWQLIGAE